ncbi:hypothetical protein DFH07DRAFT_938436 [Mycena maculata]|uniref:Uncharacterized protein n=1 Tax=Mycena maculata TaxID=230809 RepID=A0AAD7NND5_9AGAR|nr:hypothetical protein DFH07DRAFT_938436 [Mycena maculata]
MDPAQPAADLSPQSRHHKIFHRRSEYFPATVPITRDILLSDLSRSYKYPTFVHWSTCQVLIPVARLFFCQASGIALVRSDPNADGIGLKNGQMYHPYADEKAGKSTEVSSKIHPTSKNFKHIWGPASMK